MAEYTAAYISKMENGFEDIMQSLSYPEQPHLSF
jgi:hypothetical protein